MLVRKFPRRTLLILLTASLTLAACNVGATPAPTVDVNAINTAAVATAMGQISAQLTQTALAAPPTNTPPPTVSPLPLVTSALPTATGGVAPTAGVSGALPTLSFNTTPNTTQLPGLTPLVSTVAAVNTPVQGDTCHNNVFVADVTVPDDTVFKPGVNFDKTWRIQNSGSCTWDDGYQLVFVSGDRAMDPTNFVIDESSEFVESGETIDMTVELTAPLADGTYTANYRMQTDNSVFFGETIYVRIKVQK
jgi:hypothetical protein